LSQTSSIGLVLTSLGLGALLLLTGAPPAQAGVDIVPHRAIYAMSLAGARNGSPITGVSGKMLFSWGDACDGWTIEQRFQLRFAYAEGDEVQMSTNYTTWEAKDGRSYRFNVRKLVNGELDEELRGDASMPANGGAGVAHYERPQPTQVTLPAGTMFPTDHTLALLQHAAAGDKLFSRTVFDGSDSDGSTEISAVIGPERHQAIGEVSGADLVKGPFWPIRLAFFPLGSDDPSPDYEMTLNIQANGIAQSLVIDYGDFKVKALLETVEPVPKSGC
jgi:hypothetical protein